MNFIARLIEKFRRDERGAVLVEMTLITPVMLALSTGVFEFGNLIHQKLLIEAGLRDAGRYYARCSTGACDTIAKNIAVFGNGGGTGTARVSTWTTTMVTVATIARPAVDGAGVRLYRSDEVNVETVRITTSFPYTATSLLSYLGIGPFTISASHEERVIGW